MIYLCWIMIFLLIFCRKIGLFMFYVFVWGCPNCNMRKIRLTGLILSGIGHNRKINWRKTHKLIYMGLSRDFLGILFMHFLPHMDDPTKTHKQMFATHPVPEHSPKFVYVHAFSFPDSDVAQPGFIGIWLLVGLRRGLGFRNFKNPVWQTQSTFPRLFRRCFKSANYLINSTKLSGGRYWSCNKLYPKNQPY